MQHYDRCSLCKLYKPDTKNNYCGECDIKISSIYCSSCNEKTYGRWGCDENLCLTCYVETRYINCVSCNVRTDERFGKNNNLCAKCYQKIL
jgi:hypothetical protein